MALDRQSSALPPAQPYYILRGHTAQIHSVQFVRHNTRLLTGDADGWVVYWRLQIKRPLAVWKAHEGAILGTDEWGHNKIITHGRDNNLRIWQLPASDDTSLSTVLPTEETETSRSKPWLLHTLPVNTLNFCSFSMCYENKATLSTLPSSLPQQKSQHVLAAGQPILVATPATDDKKINVYQFPEEKLRYIVPPATTADTGMVMAVKIIRHYPSDSILVLAGYEGGLTAVFQLPRAETSSVQPAQLVYLSQPHTQPILSLDVSPDTRIYFTSSADAIVAAHRIPELASDLTDPLQDERSGAISAPDTAAPEDEVVSPNTSHEPHAPKKFEGSSSAPPTTSLSFAKRPVQSQTSTPAGLSSLLNNTAPQARSTPPPGSQPVTKQHPHKTCNTKHAGQQSLRVRADGRLFATGGWDSRIRVYSTKTLKEVAVLKWHKEGVYAVAFAQIFESIDLQTEEEQDEGVVAAKETGIGKLQRQREEEMQLKHLLAAGAKDGKVSLWEVF